MAWTMLCGEMETVKVTLTLALFLNQKLPQSRHTKMSEGALEAWLQCLPLLSPAAKRAIFTSADCLRDLEQASAGDLDEVASGWAPEEKASFLGAVASLSHCGARMRELERKVVQVRQEEREDAAVMINHLRKKLYDEKDTHQPEESVTKQDLADLKRSCDARIEHMFSQQQKEDAASIGDRGAKRPRIVTPEARRTQPSSGGTKKQRRTPPPRAAGVVSDGEWAKARDASALDLPVERPNNVRFNRFKRRWTYVTGSGKESTHRTIEAVYDAFIRDKGHPPPAPRVLDDDDDDGSSSSSSDDDHDSSSSEEDSSPQKPPPTKKLGVSDGAWVRARMASSRPLPLERPVRVYYQTDKGKWYYRRASGKHTSYDTIDAVYDAVLMDQGRCPAPRVLEEDDDDDDDDDETSDSSSDGIESAASMDERKAPKNSRGNSDQMWQRHRTMSSFKLPEQRPNYLVYDNKTNKWSVRKLGQKKSYPSLDAAYKALRRSTS